MSLLRTLQGTKVTRARRFCYGRLDSIGKDRGYIIRMERSSHWFTYENMPDIAKVKQLSMARLIRLTGQKVVATDL